MALVMILFTFLWWFGRHAARLHKRFPGGVDRGPRVLEWAGEERCSRPIRVERHRFHRPRASPAISSSPSNAASPRSGCPHAFRLH